MNLELNNTRFFFKIVISVLSSKFDLSTEMITAEKKL